MTMPAAKTRSFYVVGVYPSGSAMVLTLEPATLAECYRLIAWQREGFADIADWRVAYVDGGKLVDLDGNALALWSAPYTDQAWSAFLQRSGVVTPDAVAA